VNPTPRQPKPAFWSSLKAGYLDEIPHRHKFTNIEQKNKNIPSFCVRSDSHGMSTKQKEAKFIKILINIVSIVLVL